MDVIFDQYFLSSIKGSELPFSKSKPEIKIGKVGGPLKSVDESTGDVTHHTNHDI